MAESVTTNHKEYGFVRGKSKLTKERPYVEMTIVVDRKDGIGLGVCGDEVYAGAMPGWPSYPSIGYHSDDGCLFFQENEGRGLDFGEPCHAGDIMGVGALFSAGGVAETVVFTRNGALVGWAPITEPDMLYVVAAATAPAVISLNFEARSPLWQHGGPGHHAATGANGSKFSNLALAVASAKDGETVTASGGVHALFKGLKVRQSIKIDGSVSAPAVLRALGGAVVEALAEKVPIAARCGV